MRVAQVLAVCILSISNVAVQGLSLQGTAGRAVAQRQKSRHSGRQFGPAPVIHGTRNMSYEAALQVLANNSQVQTALALIQNQRSERHTGGNKFTALRASQAQTQTVAPSTNSAEALINDVVLETVNNLDIEKVECREFHISQTEAMETTHDELTEASERAAAARGEILKAEAAISNLDTLIDDAKGEIKKERAAGNQEIDALEAQLAIVVADLVVMERVLNMTTCDSSGQGLAMVDIDTTLLRCIVEDGDGEGEGDSEAANATSFIMFRATHLRKAMASLQSATAVDGIQRQFPGHVTGQKAVLLRAGKHIMHHLKKRQSEAESAEQTPQIFQLPKPLGQQPLSPKEREEEAHRQDCNFASSPACQDIKTKFETLNSELEEKRDDLKRRIKERRRAMKEAINNLKKQIAGYEYELGEQEAALAAATAELNSAEGQMALKLQEYKDLRAAFYAKLAGCKLTEDSIECSTADQVELSGTCGKNIDKFETEICGLQKVRQELAKLENRGEDAITDCQTSEWIPNVECPVSCGGGRQSFTRTITWYPHNGAACPPLEMEEDCAQDPCPVDCVVGDWGEWSACSASCDSGVRQRTRPTMVAAAHGGEACGELSQAENCHMEACDQDCVLGDWGDWATCDKGCGGGFQRSTRAVAEPAVGLGQCWEPEDPERTAWQRCNEQPCALGLVCQTKLDVILVLDSSGSVGTSGWAQTISASKQILQAFIGGNADIQVGVLTYSSQMVWTSRLSDDLPAVKSSVEGQRHLWGGTWTSRALQEARQELRNGRDDAQAVVICVTDGWPNSYYYTTQESAELRKVARLMFVAVGSGAPLSNIMTWASQPVADNVVDVSSFNGLSSSSTIDLIVADMCPSVGSGRTDP
mmetsp:Transcript_56611/g.134848  ORF Transcript_56611/g.134848 Transcript_56611/m.134848 type:complete len:874 (-) Transcript_56611:208-2829(-)